MSRTDRLIDQLVEKVNSSLRDRLGAEDVPPALRVGPTDDFGWYDWQIQKSDNAAWIEPFEAKLPGPLPPAFRSLVTRYVYPAFEVGNMWLFGNTDRGSENDLRTAIFRDKA